MTGIERLEGTFAAAGNRVTLMTHAVAGWPELGSSARILEALLGGGADFLEVQLPFSDPVADGPAIVAANHEALRAGSRTETCLSLVEGLRKRSEVPLLLMSYLNPLYAYGLEALLDRLAGGGIDGLIVPDYPDDEPELDLGRRCASRGLALVPLLAPTTERKRAAALAAASASPLCYAVTRLGVTGRRTELDPAALARLDALRAATGRRIAAGFGLRERSQVEALAGHADCAVVGSALLEAARTALREGRDAAEALEAVVAGLSGRGRQETRPGRREGDAS